MSGPSKEKDATGRQGEETAARYLERQGCAVLARNWHANPGEVDIVARCPAQSSFGGGEELVFVEVRTRHGGQGLAEESISRRKATSMAAAAFAFMAANDIDPDTTPWRIDLVAIAMSGRSITAINWIKGVVDEGMIDSR